MKTKEQALQQKRVQSRSCYLLLAEGKRIEAFSQKSFKRRNSQNKFPFVFCAVIQIKNAYCSINKRQLMRLIIEQNDAIGSNQLQSTNLSTQHVHYVHFTIKYTRLYVIKLQTMCTTQYLTYNTLCITYTEQYTVDSTQYIMDSTACSAVQRKKRR